jgi:hypothetical protein
MIGPLNIKLTKKYMTIFIIFQMNIEKQGRGKGTKRKRKDRNS